MTKLANFPPVYYISLEESEDRRKHLHEQFESYGITNLTGIISKRFAESGEIINGEFIHTLSDSCKGSIISHIKCLQHFLYYTKHEYAFICEDDLSLETLQYWDFTWEDFIQTLPDDWNVIQLSVIRDEFAPHHFAFRKREWNDWALTAYIIKRDYAFELANKHYYTSIGYNFDIEMNEIKLQPIGENIIYAQTEKAYTVPLFVENVQKFKTTLSSTDKKYEYEELNGQQKNHITSYHEVMNWWKLNEKQESVIERYAKDTENPQLNCEVARWYHIQGQTASAISYYLRAADRSENNLLSYECLIHMADCFHKQGNRHYTVRGLYKQAISLLPKRPEAYYLLARFDEWTYNYCDSYTNCTLALNNCDFTLEPLSNCEYPGKYGLFFEKAVSSYWWGKSSECRELFQLLVNEYWQELDDKHKELVESNLSRLGVTRHSQDFIPYNSSLHKDLRFKFKNSELIERNYSQVLQDMFVLSMLNGKKNGTFLEIGGGNAEHGSNTKLLEEKFNWLGITVELNSNHCQSYYGSRNNTQIINQNALEIDYKKLLDESGFDTNIIDYLQLDIEPARNTYECLLKIPFDKYQFRVITYEHDDYIDVTKSCRQLSREFLKNKGYVLIVNDISPEGVSNFEDWWVHPSLVNEKIIQRMISIQKNPHNVYDYMFKSQWYAEFETDKYIRENYFPDYNYEGIFVDVGAGPPSFISNSKHFRMNGWRTLCIEPNPKFAQQHRDNLSEVYEYACSHTEGVDTFTINYNNDNWYSEENDGVSFSSLEIKYDGVPSHNTQETIRVNKVKLDTILESQNITHVDILSIDVEGWEIQVLEGLSIQKYDPTIIVLENFKDNPKYTQYMNFIGYKQVAKLGYNEIYTRF